MGDGTLVDSMIHDGLWDSFDNVHMGLTGEHVSERYHVTPRGAGRLRGREPPARRRTRRARAGSRTRSCRCRSRRRRATPVVIDRDESIREDTTAEALGQAQAGVQEGRHRHRRQRARRQRRRRRARRDGRRGRAQQLERQADRAHRRPGDSGLEPKLVLMTPVEAVRKLLKKTGWTLEDVDLFELNEAFAVQGVAVTRELGLDPGQGQRRTAAPSRSAIRSARAARAS